MLSSVTPSGSATRPAAHHTRKCDPTCHRASSNRLFGRVAARVAGATLPGPEPRRYSYHDTQGDGLCSSRSDCA
jgi:hypothetical protein